MPIMPIAMIPLRIFQCLPVFSDQQIQKTAPKQKLMDRQARVQMDCAINPQFHGGWHFADPITGAHSDSRGRKKGSASLWPCESSYKIRLPRGIDILLQRKVAVWNLSKQPPLSKLSFEYAATPESAELSGKYTWKYKKTTKATKTTRNMRQYLLTKKGDPSRQAYATLAIDLDSPGSMPAEVQVYDNLKIKSMGQRSPACVELEQCVFLSILAIIKYEKRRPKWRRGKKADEKAEAGAQTKYVKDCGCRCHCFGKCTLAKLDAKFKDMVNVTVIEVEAEE
ncbi:hypothetical protein NHQ30_011016 [Ciborinia camelliae]|nr:hypothetical protein NHQ30_011016 [Ciborinia camelliae]